MKTERRHELQHNELADWLGVTLAKVQPYSKVILGILILLGVGAFASTYLGGQNRESDEAAWAAYFRALDTGDLAAFSDMAANYPGTSAAAWAQVATGDVKLATSLREFFADRDKAREELTKAREAYEGALKAANGNEMLEQRARFGLAQSLESLGEIDQATSQLDEIVKRWPESPVGVSATARLAQLRKPQTKEWYAWFAEQKPVKSPLSDSTFMNDLPNLPEKPDLSVPQPGQLIPGNSSPAGNGTPSTDAITPETGLGLPDLGTGVSGGTQSSDTNESPLPDLPATDAPGTDLPGVDAPAGDLPTTEGAATDAGTDASTSDPAAGTSTP